MKRRTSLICFPIIVLALFLLLFFWLRRSENRRMSVNDIDRINLSTTDVSNLTESRKSGSVSYRKKNSREEELISDLDDLITEAKRQMDANSTVADLLSKGYPLITNPRKAALEHTMKQTLPEVVLDLGNYKVAFVYNETHDVLWYPKSILAHSLYLRTNLKVLRLIEAGRENPKLVSTLLLNLIKNSLSRYPVILKQQELYHDGNMASPTIRENDSYYQAYSYEDPRREFNRLSFVIPAAFYILCNIDELSDPHLLLNWIELRKPKYQCRELDVYFIHQYLIHHEQEAAGFFEKHKNLIGSSDIFERTIKASKWDQLWDIRHPLLKVKNVNISDIKTIDLSLIPDKTDIDEAKAEQIIENFKQYVSSRISEGITGTDTK